MEISFFFWFISSDWRHKKDVVRITEYSFNLLSVNKTEASHWQVDAPLTLVKDTLQKQLMIRPKQNNCLFALTRSVQGRVTQFDWVSMSKLLHSLQIKAFDKHNLGLQIKAFDKHNLGLLFCHHKCPYYSLLILSGIFLNQIYQFLEKKISK